MLVHAVGVPQPAGGPRPAQELAHQIRGGLSGHASSAGSPLSCHSIPDPAGAHKVPGIQLLQDTAQSQVVVPSHQSLMSWSRVTSYACSYLQVWDHKALSTNMYMHQREAMLQERKLCSASD